MEAEAAQAKLAAVKEKFGREIRVFETIGNSSTSTTQVSNDEESDDFYELTTEDYYRLLATKKEDKHLKTKKIRDAEEAARRSRFTKAGIRVRFPDNHTLEVTFHPSEKIQSLFDFLKDVVAQPELPYYLYTVPPKVRIKDLSQDFYAAGFVPGAIVYFSYDLPKEDDNGAASSGPFLREEIMLIKGLDDFTSVPAEPDQPDTETVPIPTTRAPQETKPAEKKAVKPKWLKM